MDNNLKILENLLLDGSTDLFAGVFERSRAAIFLFYLAVLRRYRIQDYEINNLSNHECDPWVGYSDLVKNFSKDGFMKALFFQPKNDNAVCEACGRVIPAAKAGHPHWCGGCGLELTGVYPTVEYWQYCDIQLSALPREKKIVRAIELAKRCYFNPHWRNPITSDLVKNVILEIFQVH